MKKRKRPGQQGVSEASYRRLYQDFRWQVASGFDGPVFPSEEPAAGRTTWEGRVWERMWEFLIAGDPEAAIYSTWAGVRRTPSEEHKE